MIYRNHCSQQAVSKATLMAVTWIKNKILHGYYMPSTEDRYVLDDIRSDILFLFTNIRAIAFCVSRLLIEKLLNTSLVPYHLPPEEKMKRLYHLMGTVDDNASRAFIELQKHQALSVINSLMLSSEMCPVLYYFVLQGSKQSERMVRHSQKTGERRTRKRNFFVRSTSLTVSSGTI